MNNAGDGNGRKEFRRQVIANLMIQRPNITQRQIQTYLAEKAANPQVGAMLTNPATGKPYSLGTINSDMQAIRREWQERATERYDYWLGVVNAELDAIVEAAWRDKDLKLLLSCNQRRAKLLGLDAPKRRRNFDIDLQTLTDEQLTRLAAGEDVLDVLTGPRSG